MAMLNNQMVYIYIYNIWDLMGFNHDTYLCHGFKCFFNGKQCIYIYKFQGQIIYPINSFWIKSLKSRNPHGFSQHFKVMICSSRLMCCWFPPPSCPSLGTPPDSKFGAQGRIFSVAGCRGWSLPWHCRCWKKIWKSCGGCFFSLGKWLDILRTWHV